MDGIKPVDRRKGTTKRGRVRGQKKRVGRVMFAGVSPFPMLFRLTEKMRERRWLPVNLRLEHNKSLSSWTELLGGVHGGQSTMNRGFEYEHHS